MPRDFISLRLDVRNHCRRQGGFILVPSDKSAAQAQRKKTRAFTIRPLENATDLNPPGIFQFFFFFL